LLSVIMAGGVGERFWPRSRRKTPKQLLDLTGKGSMISLTVDRLHGISKPEEVFVVTVADQRDAVADALTGIPSENIIGEPVGRNTAPSVGLAAVVVRHRFGDVPFAVLPADHLIVNQDRFQACMSAAEAYVSNNDCLLTFGIKPTRPETGYGYVHSGARAGSAEGSEVLAVEQFCEKPSIEEARRFVSEGSYYWNSGMFCWRPGVILSAMETHLPELYSALLKIEAGMGTGDLDTVLKDVYPQAPRISIDYGVMEKADNVVVLPADFDWNDLGSWESVREIYPEDSDGNVLVGDHVAVDSANNTIFSPDRTVGLVGIEDVVVVSSEDAILICARSEVQKVRGIVDALKNKRRDDLL
jgi:mannose-1-phosphate guanylyltransferase